VDDVEHGTLTLDLDGSFSYVPDAGYSGPDSFTYHATDGTDDSNVATVNVTVTSDGVAISGTVTADGDPLAGAWIEVYRASAASWVAAATSAADGTYSVTLPSGSYKLRIVSNEPGFANAWHGGSNHATATAISSSSVVDFELTSD
jgi:hypothetical protein